MWILLVGYGRSGKDTVADHLCKMECGFGEKMAFADLVRDFAADLNGYLPEISAYYADVLAERGYDEAKKIPCVRNYLVSVGHGGREALWQTVWIDGLDRMAKARPNGGIHLPLVISDGRYANEADYVRNRGNAVVIRLKRKGCKAKHQTEKDSIKEIVPDYVIRNDGSKEELFAAVEAVLKSRSEQAAHKKIYVAGAFVDQETVNMVQGVLLEKLAGCVITFDWTKQKNSRETSPLDSCEEEDLDYLSLSKSGMADLEGVQKADYLVAVFNDPTYAYRGTFTEFGIALGMGKKVVALHLQCDREEEKKGTVYKRNPFLWLAQVVHVYSVNELLEVLHKL